MAVPLYTPNEVTHIATAPNQVWCWDIYKVTFWKKLYADLESLQQDLYD